MNLEEHPTVQSFRSKQAAGQAGAKPKVMEAARLKEMARAAGAHEVGLVEVERAELAPWREDTLALMPGTKTLVSLIERLNPANVRCPTRSVSDLEFSRGMHAADQVAHNLTEALAPLGVRAMVVPAGFPMDMSQWPGKMWAVSHKPVAVAAGLGQMGLNRLLLNPRFGGFVVLGTLLIDVEADQYDQPVDFNPCLDCKLCAAACPVGAIGNDGHFAFVNCMTHNYRDRLGGFQDWAEQLVNSKNSADYRRRVSDQETVSMWQSLSYGICNKSSYCMAACPAGEENIGPFLEDRKAYLERVLKPMTDKAEDIYVVPGSDSEEYVPRRFPHKRIKRVFNGVRPSSVENFLGNLAVLFQRGKAKEMDTTYHLSFYGSETAEATVIIKQGTLQVLPGHQGKADLALKADSDTWISFLTKEKSLLPALLSGKMKIKGPPRLMKAFAACFPS
jgi:ferredoxin